MRAHQRTHQGLHDKPLFSIFYTHMPIIPIAAVTGLAALSCVAREPLNRAFSVLRDIKFVILSDSAVLKEFSIPGRLWKKGTPIKRTSEIHATCYSTTNALLTGLPYLNVLQYLWTTFFTALISTIVCIFLGLLQFPILEKQVNLFALGFIVILVILLRFGIMSAFNRKIHAKFAFLHFVVWTIIGFIVLRKAPLGIFDVRFAILSLFPVQGLVLDIGLAFGTGIFAAAFLPGVVGACRARVLFLVPERLLRSKPGLHGGAGGHRHPRERHADARTGVAELRSGSPHQRIRVGSERHRGASAPSESADSKRDHDLSAGPLTGTVGGGADAVGAFGPDLPAIGGG